MDFSIIYEIIIAAVALIALGYIVSLFLHKRHLDAIQTTVNSTMQATVGLISVHTYYGAYERSEFLRVLSSVIGADIVTDVRREVQSGESPYRVEIYPPSGQAVHVYSPPSPPPPGEILKQAGQPTTQRAG